MRQVQLLGERIVQGHLLPSVFFLEDVRMKAPSRVAAKRHFIGVARVSGLTLNTEFRNSVSPISSVSQRPQI